RLNRVGTAKTEKKHRTEVTVATEDVFGSRITGLLPSSDPLGSDLGAGRPSRRNESPKAMFFFIYVHKHSRTLYASPRPPYTPCEAFFPRYASGAQRSW